VLGEMVPKNLSFSAPERAVLLLAPPLVMFSRVFRPIIFTLNWLANRVLHVFKVEPKDEATSTYTLDEVAAIVEQSTREGVLADKSGTLSNTFDFTAKKVADVHVPLSETVMLPDTSTPADVQRAAKDHGFSRYVITDAAGEPSGYLHLKDVLDLSSPEAFQTAVPRKRIRHLNSVFCDSDLEDALATMRRTGSHLVRAVNADGQVGGVLFLEDIIEELVGEVEDVTSQR